jgi:hypothetical protein
MSFEKSSGTQTQEIVDVAAAAVAAAEWRRQKRRSRLSFLSMEILYETVRLKLQFL